MLPRSQKINTQLFKKVLLEGKNYNFVYFSVKKLRILEESKNKFAFVISKKILKKAVERNLIKRRFFNLIKTICPENLETSAIIFFCKKGVEKLDFGDLKKEIANILEKLVK